MLVKIVGQQHRIHGMFKEFLKGFVICRTVSQLLLGLIQPKGILIANRNDLRIVGKNTVEIISSAIGTKHTDSNLFHNKLLTLWF